MAEAAVPDVIEREMSATPDDIARAVRFAFPAAVASEDKLYWKVGAGGTALQLTLTPLPPRRIALLELPRLQARLSFSGGDDATRSALLAQLDRALQRGGG